MTNDKQLAVFGEEPEGGYQTGYSSARAASAKSLRAYVEAPLRRPLHVLVPLGITLSLAVGASVLLHKMYRSATLILVESEKMPDSFVRSMATETTNKRLMTIRQEILSRTRLEKILEELKPYPGNQSITEGVESMRGAIEINVKGTDAFSIEYVHRDPKKAREVTSRLATLFIEESMKSREQQVEEAYQFLDSEVVAARRELEVKDAALRQYKEQHMGNLPEQTQANLTSLQILQQEQQALEVSLRDARQRQDLLERNLSEPQKRATAANSTAAVEGTSDLDRLRDQLLNLRSRYTEEHPDVQSLKNRIARTEKLLADAAATSVIDPVDPSMGAARSQLEKVKIEIRSLESKRADLEARIGSFRARVEQVPRTEQELATLTRDYQKLNENYLALLTKKLDAKMAAKLEQRWKGEHFTILDPAHLPEQPYWPNRPLLLGMGLFIGLTLGIALAVAGEFFDNTIKDQDDLESLIPYPVLATVSHVPQVEAASRLLISSR
jgi:polysaccharide chain length determinant protein (PEP-CTERM system associated)